MHKNLTRTFVKLQEKQLFYISGHAAVSLSGPPAALQRIRAANTYY